MLIQWLREKEEANGGKKTVGSFDKVGSFLMFLICYYYFFYKKKKLAFDFLQFLLFFLANLSF